MLKASKRNLFVLVSGFGIAGIALKFVTFFDRWVYFPSFPNIADSAFLLLASAYLVWCALHEKKC